jgi:lipoprotein-anchoring transpeptidase ErfK/SrfK
MTSRTQQLRKYHRRDSAYLKWVLLAAIATAVTVDATGQEQRQPELRIVVSVADRKLVLLSDDKPVKLYPVAVGKDSTPTPTGEFKIINRIADPTYYHPGIVMPPGPNNPLGHRWMGLNAKGYGIHGTPDQDSIGQAASTGCIRMARTDLEEIFEVVRPGMTVHIVAAAEGELAQLMRAADMLLLAQANPEPATAAD